MHALHEYRLCKLQHEVESELKPWFFYGIHLWHSSVDTGNRIWLGCINISPPYSFSFYNSLNCSLGFPFVCVVLVGWKIYFTTFLHYFYYRDIWWSLSVFTNFFSLFCLPLLCNLYHSCIDPAILCYCVILKLHLEYKYMYKYISVYSWYFFSWLIMDIFHLSSLSSVYGGDIWAYCWLTTWSKNTLFKIFMLK